MFSLLSSFFISQALSQNPQNLLGEWEFDDNYEGRGDGVIGDIRAFDDKSSFTPAGLVLNSGAVVTSEFLVDAELGSKRTISSYVTVNDPSKTDGAVIGIEGYTKASKWTSFFGCAGSGQTPDRILYDYRRDLARAVGVRICSRGNYNDCVTSKGINTALKTLQSGTFSLQPRGLNKCDGACILKEWEGPTSRLRQMIWNCDPRESNYLYHACGNQGGLHISSRGRGDCEWDHGTSDALEIQLLVEDVEYVRSGIQETISLSQALSPSDIEAGKKMLMTMVVDEGNVALYRDSQLLSTSRTQVDDYAAGSWRLVFGGSDSDIDVTIHRAAVWDRAFAPSEVSNLCDSLGDCDVKVPDTSCFATGYRPARDPFQLVREVETAFDCQHHCYLSSRCKYFRFWPTNKSCSLYDAHGRLSRVARSIFGPKECPKHMWVDTTKIICPYLATLVNEGALPVREEYSKQELEMITVQSGVPEGTVAMHVHGGNFFHNPSGVQNIFDMEGAVNEHITSTGIHDCKTDYSRCPESTKWDPEGTEKCPGAVTEDCVLPNVDIFERFFDHTDANDDGFIDNDEMKDDANNFPVVDENRVTGLGSIEGGFNAFINLLGVDNDGNHQIAFGNSKMDRETMRRGMISRKFPEWYTFPYICGGANFVQLGEWRFGPVANGNHFSFSHRKSDRAVVYDASGMNFNGGGNNFRLWDEKMMSGEYPSNVQLGSVFTFGGAWKIGNIDDAFVSIAMQGDTGAVFGAWGNAREEHPEGEGLWGQEEELKSNFFGDRFIQFGNFRFADAGNERFSISHSAFQDQGITFLENGEVVEGEFDYHNDVWDRPVEGTCDANGCVHM